MASLQTRTNADGSTSYRVLYRLQGRQKVLTYGAAVTARSPASARWAVDLGTPDFSASVSRDHSSLARCARSSCAT